VSAVDRIEEKPMNTAMYRNLLGAAIAAAGVTLAGASHGAIFNSHFDPNSFSGDGTFQIDDACLAREDGFYTDCNAVLLAATADIVSESGGTAHVDFGPVLPSSAVLDVEISGGTLVGVDTDWIGWAFADQETCTGDLCGTIPWWIRWVNPDFDPVELATGSCDGVESCEMSAGNPFAIADVVTFTRVPEPGTLALVAAGLVLAWRTRPKAALRR
jgi:hypothetical protein